MNRNFRLLLFVVAFLCVAMFGAAIAMPKPVLAWNSACQLDPAITMTTADLTVLPDGTVYAITFQENVNTVYRWKPPSCSITTVKTFSSAEDAPLTTESIEGPVQSARPDIASNSKGDIVVQYRVGSSFPYKIYFARKPANQAQFQAPVLVTDNGYAGDIKLDEQGRVHLTYYRSAQGVVGGFYQRFNRNNASAIGPLQLTGYNDAEPELDLDSQGNAHVVYMDDGNDLSYRKISAGGAMGAERILVSDHDAFFPYIAVDTTDRLHIVWQGRVGSTHQIYYLKCNNEGKSCGSKRNLSNSGGNNSLDGHVEVCGTTPYVSWYLDNDAAGNTVFVSRNLQNGQDVSGNVSGASAFNILGVGAGKAIVAFRNASAKLSYTYQDDENCVAQAPQTPTNTSTPTDTATPTFTPTVTETLDPSITPTDTPTPTTTFTPSPTPTNTSPAPKKTYYDNKSPDIQYSGTWNIRNGSPSCLYKNSYSIAGGKAANHLSLNFNGTRIKYWFVTGPGMGKVQVFIDGNLMGTANLTRANVLCKPWTSPVLAAGDHTLELRPKPKTGKINIDVITVFP